MRNEGGGWDAGGEMRMKRKVSDRNDEDEGKKVVYSVGGSDVSEVECG